MLTVRQARRIKDLSQKQVANELGVDVGTYRRIENNPEKATIEFARRFCEIVDVNLDDIFFSSDSTKSRERNGGVTQ